MGGIYVLRTKKVRLNDKNKVRFQKVHLLQFTTISV